MEELVRYYLRSLEDMLVILGVEHEAALRVVAMVRHGSRDAGVLVEHHLLSAAGRLEGARASLPGLIDLLAEYSPRLDGENVNPSDLETTAQILTDVAVTTEALGNSSTAYNFHEAAYSILTECGLPALSSAEKLHALSNHDKTTQFHSAIWRLATERLRHAIEQDADWLAAFDAVELALTCVVPDQRIQQALFEKLHEQVQRAQGTPLEEILFIVIIQAPSGVLPPGIRLRAMTALVQNRFGTPPEDVNPIALESAATTVVQMTAGDLRLKLLPQQENVRQVDIHDVRYRDHRLMNAVPLGKSLIADPRRTAELLLDMAHEIAHAVVLQGALGTRQAIYRAVVTYCELFLQSESLNSSEEMKFDRLTALPELPQDNALRVLADVQLASAEKAAVELAVWRSWLEGVSLYIELLCDPKDDPSEISLVHSCIRGLIDFDIPRRPSETEPAYIERFSQEMVGLFENFLSTAIGKQSRHNHIGYLDIDTRRSAERDIYNLGYLVVRSVVSAWEKRCGRRIPPAIASRLLLNATQAGTFGALPDPTDEAALHWEQAQKRYFAWVAGLAELDKEVLEEFFRPTPSDERGNPWIWTDGTPRRVLEIDESIRSREREEAEKVYRQASQLAGINPDTEDEIQLAVRGTLINILGQQIEWNRLLPIGSDRCRLIFLEAADLVCLAIRTYGGRNGGTATVVAASAATATTHDPRYNVRTFRLPGGRTEADALRTAFARAGTARAYATRIVDLRGHPDAPDAAMGASYVCAFLPSGFSHIVRGGTQDEISKSHPTFCELLRSRVFPPFSFGNEGETLASLAFLDDRAQRSNFHPPIPRAVPNADLVTLSHNVALTAAALAFAGGSDEAFRGPYELAVANKSYRYALANVLHSSGRSLPLSGDSAPDQAALKGKPLSALLFRTETYSAIAAFGDKL
jgi:hypothetical protein